MGRNPNRPGKLPADTDDQEDLGFGFDVKSTFLAGLTLEVDHRLGGFSVFLGIGLGLGGGGFLVESNSFFAGLAAGGGFGFQAGISLLLLLNVFRNLTSLKNLLGH